MTTDGVVPNQFDMYWKCVCKNMMSIEINYKRLNAHKYILSYNYLMVYLHTCKCYNIA